jgi:hypothetical protein
MHFQNHLGICVIGKKLYLGNARRNFAGLAQFPHMPQHAINQL